MFVWVSDRWVRRSPEVKTEPAVQAQGESAKTMTKSEQTEPTTWALMLVRVYSDGTPVQPLEVKPPAVEPLDQSSPSASMPKDSAPNESLAPGSSGDDLKSLILSMRQDPGAWKRDLPEIRLKALAVEVTLPAAKGDASGVKRSQWPKELTPMDCELSGFEEPRKQETSNPHKKKTRNPKHTITKKIKTT